MAVKIALDNVYPFISEAKIKEYGARLERAQNMLEQGDGPGGEFTGWLRLPGEYDKMEFTRIKDAAAKIQKQSEALIVIGIGGSYLGARSAIEFLCSPNYNLIKKNTPDVFFAGNNLSGAYLNEIIELIGDRDFSINVISKSGTTTEPAVAFRVWKELAEKKYGLAGAKERIYATTDKSRGALKKLADMEGYECFVIPDDIGGRYSVLTPVGLLPIAVAGIDIGACMDGAAAAMNELKARRWDNPAWRYAAARNALYDTGKTTEIFAAYEPSARFIAEWWKQLFGESEGKEGKGIYPASVDFTADLHSMGQYIQEGRRNIFETVLSIARPCCDITLVNDPDDLDGLNFLAGKTLSHINRQAFLGTILAHADGGVPSIIAEIPEINEREYGYLVYFFELACGLSGYILGVNPFDQPGVEAYKKNMFALLGKPGYEKEREDLSKRLNNI